MQSISPPVFVVDGARTPFFKFRNTPGVFTATELALAAARPLFNRLPIDASHVDEVIVGCVIPSPHEGNIARITALRLGCDVNTPAWTVQRQCASGMQALDCACKDIQSGRANIILAGGTEAMSHAPLLWKTSMVRQLAAWKKARSLFAKFHALRHLRPAMLTPVVALLCGLRDPVVGLSMGVTAEILAEQFAIKRTEMDAFAMRSHRRLAAAQTDHMLAEIVPIYSKEGAVYTEDDGLRATTSMASLAKLRPVFEPPYGCVTAGNSSQISDGAAMLLLAGEQAVHDYQLPVLGRIHGCTWAGVKPEWMGLGPVHSTAALLQQQQMAISDVDYWELNEAFAVQVQACLAASASADWSRQHLGLTEALGLFNEDQLNIHGGAIAIGHPVGATGARLVLHLLHVLQQQHTHCGVATLCIGGGQGGSMMVVRDP